MEKTYIIIEAGLAIEVKILETKEKFGRHMSRITPIAGGQNKWVNSNRLIEK